MGRVWLFPCWGCFMALLDGVPQFRISSSPPAASPVCGVSGGFCDTEIFDSNEWGGGLLQILTIGNGMKMCGMK